MLLKYSMASCIAIYATNAVLSAWTWGMRVKIKKYVEMVQKAGAGTLEIRLLRIFDERGNVVVNMVIKLFGKKESKN